MPIVKITVIPTNLAGLLPSHSELALHGTVSMRLPAQLVDTPNRTRRPSAFR